MHQINKIRELVRIIRDIAKDYDDESAPTKDDLLGWYARMVGAGIGRIHLMDHYAAEIGERLDALEQELETTEDDINEPLGESDPFDREKLMRLKPW